MGGWGEEVGVLCSGSGERGVGIVDWWVEVWLI